MLVDSDDLKASRFQVLANPSVACLVGSAFLVPEAFVGLGAGVALGTAVPEATIDKYRHFFADKAEVRLSWQREVTPPAGDTVFTKQLDQHQLRGLVTLATDTAHHQAALFNRPNVGHIFPSALPSKSKPCKAAKSESKTRAGLPLEQFFVKVSGFKPILVIPYLATSLIELKVLVETLEDLGFG
jgi:hypothetical protein